MEKRKMPVGVLSNGLSAMQGKPVMMAVILLAGYFAMDSLLLNTGEDVGGFPAEICRCLSLAVFYVCYVAPYVFGCQVSGCQDIPSWVKQKKQYASAFFWLLAIFTSVFSLGYDEIILGLFPNLNQVYYPSQVYMFILIAPFIEELIFRYFLYDRWARIKYGKVRGMLLAGLAFIICHPITGMDGFIFYWVPTLVFYLVYDSFGLYGSVLAHMVYNFIAL